MCSSDLQIGGMNGGGAVAVDCRMCMALKVASDRQVEMRLHVAWFQQGRLAKSGGGLGQVAAIQTGQAETVVRLGIAGFESQGFMEQRNCRRGLVLYDQARGAVHQNPGRRWMLPAGSGRCRPVDLRLVWRTSTQGLSERRSPGGLKVSVVTGRHRPGGGSPGGGRLIVRGAWGHRGRERLAAALLELATTAAWARSVTRGGWGGH